MKKAVAGMSVLTACVAAGGCVQPPSPASSEVARRVLSIDGTATGAPVTNFRPAVLYLEGNKAISGMMAWDEASGSYVVSNRTRNTTFRVASNRVVRVVLERRTDVAKAVSLMREGRHSAAIPLLRRILSDRLGDPAAGRRLAECYVHVGRPELALELFSDMKWLLDGDSGDSEACRRIREEALEAVGNRGTLTFTGDAVVFRSATRTNEFRLRKATRVSGPRMYPLLDIPGLCFVEFVMKTELQRRPFPQTVDRSALVVKNAEGEPAVPNRRLSWMGDWAWHCGQRGEGVMIRPVRD